MLEKATYFRMISIFLKYLKSFKINFRNVLQPKIEKQICPINRKTETKK